MMLKFTKDQKRKAFRTRSTSFQALLLIHNKSFNLNSKNVFNYEHILADDYKDINANITQKMSWVIFPWSECWQRSKLLCIAKIPKVFDSFINLTVHQVSYDGPAMFGDECKYGGMATYFRTNNHYKRASLWCEDVNSGDMSVRLAPLISESDVAEVWVVVYAYDAYSSLRANITVSLTDCVGVLIDISCPVPLTSQGSFTVWLIFNAYYTYTTLQIRLRGNKG